MVQHSFILEHTIHHKDFESTWAIELLGTLNFLDIVTKVPLFVKIVVMEFYSNLTKGMGDPTSPDFQKVYVRGHQFDFLPSILNAYLGCPNPKGPIIQPPVHQVVSVIIGGKLSSWPAKGNVPSSILSTKFCILHKIIIYNWLPGNHKSHVTKALASLLFQIGTKQRFNLGRLMFDHFHDMKNLLF